jgi:3-hydroxyisobutyrate dehydrogenase-like beta-hydroxyacid dehydrogenase
MDDRSEVRVGIIGFGEVGHGLALGLREAGLRSIAVLQRDAGRPLIQARLAETAAELVGSPSELAERADVIMVTTTGAESLGVAESMAVLLGPEHVYADLASSSPAIARLIARLVSMTGARAADGALMGSTLEFGLAVPIMLSGPGAEDFVRLMAPWGMRLQVVGDEAGHAAAIKTLRHTLMKGQIALLAECAVAAQRYGVLEPLLQSVADWYDTVPFRTNASRVVRTTVVHARRRADEARSAEALLAELGIDPTMTRATTAVLDRISALDLDTGSVPASLEHALELIEPAIFRRPATD